MKDHRKMLRDKASAARLSLMSLKRTLLEIGVEGVDNELVSMQLDLLRIQEKAIEELDHVSKSYH